MSECTHDCSSCGSDCGSRQEPQSFLEEPNKMSNIGKVIGVVSGKGGVGKTLVSSLLAVSMQRLGKNVGIMDADMFGLSGLHQLRGRVGRNSLQSYCLLRSEDFENERLQAMLSTNNGFEIAEADLRLRGPGDLEGTLQSGLPFNLRVADLSRDGALLTMARDEAEQLLTSDPMLSHPENALLLNQLHSKTRNVVNWSFIS